MRLPSVAKQRRLTVRPRPFTRATGCRWPAISPSAPARSGSWRNISGADREHRRRDAADARRPARDRDCRRSRSSRGRAAARASIARSSSRHALRPVAVVEAVAERDHDARRVARDRARRAAPASPRCHRAAAARRARRSSSLFRDAGRRRPAGLPPANRARRRNRRPARRRRSTTSPPRSQPTCRLRRLRPFTASPPSPVPPRLPPAASSDASP